MKTIVLTLVVIFSVACSKGGTSRACTDNSQCSHSSTCQNGTCQAQTATNCKHSAVCGTVQACIRGTCQTNQCTSNSDCTAFKETCQQGACKTETATSCKNSWPCTNTGQTNNLGCVLATGVCGCNAPTDCSSGYQCSSNQCEKTSCTQDSDCNQNAGRVCDTVAKQCIVKTCIADTQCPGTSVCSGTTSGACGPESAGHCKDTTPCTLGQVCTLSPPVSGTCTSVSCTTNAKCTSPAVCISGNCQANQCKSTSDCTDPAQVCDPKSQQCVPQSSSNCRPGFACPTQGDTCQTGQCSCNPPTAGCSASDYCSAGKCLPQSITHCLTSQFCSTQLKTADTCNANNLCVCGTQASACQDGQICSSGKCISANSRFLFVSSNTYNGNLGGLSGANQNCQNSYNSWSGKPSGSTVNFGAVLATDSQSLYQVTYGFAANQLQVIDAVNDTPISEPLPTTASTTCSNPTPGFDCIDKWQNNPSTLPTTGQSLNFWTGAPYLCCPNKLNNCGGHEFTCAANQEFFYLQATGPVACSVSLDLNSSWQSSNSSHLSSTSSGKTWNSNTAPFCNQNSQLLCLESD